MYCVHVYSTFHGHNIGGHCPSNKILGGGQLPSPAPPVPTPLSSLSDSLTNGTDCKDYALRKTVQRLSHKLNQSQQSARLNGGKIYSLHLNLTPTWREWPEVKAASPRFCCWRGE